MQQKIIVTMEQRDKMRPFLPNVDEICDKMIDCDGDETDILLELNDVIVGELDKDYNDTPNSIMLQNLYDEIIENNH